MSELYAVCWATHPSSFTSSIYAALCLAFLSICRHLYCCRPGGKRDGAQASPVCPNNPIDRVIQPFMHGSKARPCVVPCYQGEARLHGQTKVGFLDVHVAVSCSKGMGIYEGRLFVSRILGSSPWLGSSPSDRFCTNTTSPFRDPSTKLDILFLWNSSTRTHCKSLFASLGPLGVLFLLLTRPAVS